MISNHIKYLLLLVLGFASVVGFSQTELKNQVFNEAMAAPIENASVYVKNTTIGTVTNADGKFNLLVAKKFEKDTLIVSSIGFKTFKTVVSEFDDTMPIFLESEVASLDEVLIVADNRPKTGNDIVKRALEDLAENLPDSMYLQKGFLRHKERNKKEFKWLIEGAITVLDSSYASNVENYLKVNVDQVRKSYDLRDVDSLFAYSTYLKYNANLKKLKAKNLIRDTIKTTSLIKAIRWNDTRVNGLETLFKGKLNLVRNSGSPKALFGKNVFSNHQFELDTVLVDNDRRLYKIKIKKGADFVGLNTKGIFNEGFNPRGWLYIYWDTFAIKKIEYELVAASKAQKSRSKTLFGTQLNHKLIITYMEYKDKMYPNYFYYETPKLVSAAYKPSSGVTTKEEMKQEEERYYKEGRYNYTVQEILFSEIITDSAQVKQELISKKWDADMFSPKPYDKAFWKSYNTLLESEEDEKLIKDLTKRSSLFKD